MYTSATSTVFTVGSTGSFPVTVNAVPAAATPTLASGSLPSGVSFNAGTGTLSGTPGAGTSGTYSLTFDAANGVGTTVQHFTLDVMVPVNTVRSYNFVAASGAPTTAGFTNALPTDTLLANGDHWTTTVQAYNTGSGDGDHADGAGRGLRLGRRPADLAGGGDAG